MLMARWIPMPWSNGRMEVAVFLAASLSRVGCHGCYSWESNSAEASTMIFELFPKKVRRISLS